MQREHLILVKNVTYIETTQEAKEEKTLGDEMFLTSVHASMKRSVYFFVPFTDKVEPKIMLTCVQNWTICISKELIPLSNTGSFHDHLVNLFHTC